MNEPKFKLLDRVRTLEPESRTGIVKNIFGVERGDGKAFSYRVLLAGGQEEQFAEEKLEAA